MFGKYGWMGDTGIRRLVQLSKIRGEGLRMEARMVGVDQKVKGLCQMSLDWSFTIGK